MTEPLDLDFLESRLNQGFNIFTHGVPPGSTVRQLIADLRWFRADNATLIRRLENFHDEAQEEYKKLFDKYELLRKAAEALNNRLDEIWKDSSFKEIHFLAASHGVLYTGPKCTDEQAALRAALEEGKT